MCGEVTKKREGIDRFVVNGLSFALVGVGWWVLSLVIDGPFLMRSLVVSFVLVGRSSAGAAMLVIAYRKSDGASHWATCQFIHGNYIRTVGAHRCLIDTCGRVFTPFPQ